ncbi:hypothetical protein [Streptococcus ruminantium]|uniref:hypothetical protein n=1 Tax=Streptococcus ruminantium TaxID=1917441 RepID=UPI0012DF6FBA|nr:hypothetical protein [Streptococcus ruminantium]
MLPNNGSIVIIDDQIAEARPLFSFLSKENKSFRYFDGRGSSLPIDDEGDKEAVRLIFLDYNLTAGSTGSTNISAIMANLSRLISNKNGPYYILLWSKEKGEQDSEGFIEELTHYITDETCYLLPSGVEYLDKQAYFAYDSENNEYNFKTGKVQELKDKIFEIINGLSLLEFFVKWENQVLLTSQKLVSKTREITDTARDLAYHLAKVNLEQSTSNLPNEKLISAAYQSLNTVYSTYLNHKVEEIKLDNEEFQNLSSQSSTISNKGRINSWLNINSLENPSHIGKVFCETGQFSDIHLINPNVDGHEKDFLNKALEILSDDDSTSKGYYFKEVGLEVSPECDFAQNKRNFYRIIPGVLISKELLKATRDDLGQKLKYNVNEDGTLKRWGGSKNILFSPIFEYKYEDNDYVKKYDVYLILDLSQFKTVPIKDGKHDYFETKDALFSLNNDMLQWVKNTLASNIQKKGYQLLI